MRIPKELRDSIGRTCHFGLYAASAVAGRVTAALGSRPRSSNDRRVLAYVILPADHGSVGDEAMISVATSELTRRGYKVQLIQPTATLHASEAGAIAGNRFFGPGPPRPEPWIKQMAVDGAVAMVIGADMMDGAYGITTSLARLTFLNIAASLGMKPVLAGFSQRDDAPRALQRAFTHLDRRVTLCARDLDSADRVRAIAPRADVRSVADLAFLMRPQFGAGTAEARAFADQARREGKRVVGVCINLNRAMLNKEKVEDEAYIQQLQRTLAELARRTDVAYLFIPHDRRAHSDDRVGNDAVIAGLGGGKETSLIHCDDLSAPETKAVASLCDMVITGRTHLAIAALGSGVPALPLDYQGKVTGLMRLCGLDGHFVTFESLRNPVELGARMVRLLDAAPESRTILERYLPDIKAQALSNFQGL